MSRRLILPRPAVENISARYAAGETLTALSVEYGVTTRAVQKAAQRYGVALRAASAEQISIERCISALEREREQATPSAATAIGRAIDALKTVTDLTLGDLQAMLAADLTQP